MATTSTRRTRRPAYLCAYALVAFVAPAVRTQPGFAQRGPAPVAVADVIVRDVATGKQFVGTVMPLRTSSVGTAVDGRVVEFPVNRGDRVSKGQSLVRLRTKTLEIELAAARAELELREQELAELRNGSRPEEIEQAKAAMLAAKARSEYARQDFTRVSRLYEQGTAADDEFDEAKSRADETLQQFLEHKAAYELVVAGPRAERIAQAQARARAQQEAIHRLEDLIGKHVAVAPFDGYIASENTEIGEWITNGQIVVTVIELDVVEVQVPVVEDFATHLRPGTPARIEIPSLPTESFTGVVSEIVPQAETRSRSFPVFVRTKNRIDHHQPVIKAGMFARVTLPVGNRQKALLVPKDAIVLGGPSPVVFVVQEHDPGPGPPTVRSIPVELGVADGGWIQVIGDIEEGQAVVVRGNERLRSGQPIRITEAIGEPTQTATKPSRTRGGLYLDPKS